MDKPLIYLLVFFAGITALKGNDYAVQKISPDLLANSVAVVRQTSTTYDVRSKSDVRISYHYVVTILSEAGKDEANFMKAYNKYSEIRRFSGKIYDASGEEIRKVRNRDLKDRNLRQGFYSDTRLAYYEPHFNRYPYTVEYRFEYRLTDPLSYPRWFPQYMYNLAIEYSECELRVPEELELRIIEHNLPQKAQVTVDKGSKLYLWELSEIPALVHEPYSPLLFEKVPNLSFIPLEFEREKIAGSFRSWNEFGKWIQELNHGMDRMTEDQKLYFLEKFGNLENDMEKINAVYDYLQNTTRYVDIQIGMGALQPTKAEQVHQRKYGDCKDLSIYMQGILNLLGVRSYYSLVSAGDNPIPIDPNVPDNYFNHAFLFIPTESDTLWVECTSQYHPPGFLGSFTDNRHALLVTENGGVLTTTKAYEGIENRNSIYASAKLSDLQNANFSAELTNRGPDFIPAAIYEQQDRSDIISWLRMDMAVPGMEISNFSFEEKRDIYPELKTSVDFRIPNFLTQLNNRLLFHPSVFHSDFAVPSQRNERIWDIEVRREKNVYDEIIYQLPEGYNVETLPEKSEMDSPFGYFSMEIREDEDELLMKREFVLYSGRYPKEKFNEFASFLKFVRDADRQRLVLQKED